MVVQLSRPSSKPVIELNRDDSVPSDQSACRAIGLGALEEYNPDWQNGDFPDVLQQVDLQVVPHSTCKTKFQYGWVHEPSMICAADTFKDGCQGT